MFKYYISKLGSRPVLILLTQGGGVQDLGKPVDVILERSLMSNIPGCVPILQNMSAISGFITDHFHNNYKLMAELCKLSKS